MIFSSVFTAFETAHAAESTPATLIYEGRVLKPDGTPLEAASVVFTLQVRSPGAENCLLFEESHTVNMTGSEGLFSLIVGAGLPTGNSTAYSLTQVFLNNASFSGLTCQIGVAYTPVSSATRKIRISFDDGTNVVTVTPDHEVHSVPYALNASRLGGLDKSAFIQTNTATSDLTQVKIDQVFQTANFTELMNLISGSSSQYAKSSDLPVSGGVLNLSSGGVTVPNTPASGTAAVNRNYVDSVVGGKTVDVSAVSAASGNGKVLTWDQAGNRWQASDVSDASKLPLTGGTLSGALNLGGNNLLAAGHVQLDPQKTLLLGTYTNAQEGTLTSTLAAGDRGRAWYNTETGKVRFWDGSTAQDIGASGANYVAKAGDTMTGPLVNNANSASTALAVTQSGSGYAATFMGGRVGVGTSTPTDLHTVIDMPVITAGTRKTSSVATYHYPTGNSTADFVGFSSYLEFNDQGSNYSGGNYKAIHGLARRYSSFSLASLMGVEGEAKVDNGLGAITSAYGVKGYINGDTPSANKISSGYAGYFSTTGLGASTITNGYGVYIGTIGGATNKWSLYASDAAAPSYFAGSVGIGSSPPVAKLDVAGNIKIGNSGVVTCDASKAGSIRYNAGNLEFCNSTAWTVLVGGSAVTSLNGLTGSTQTFAIGTSGNAPEFNSSGTTHTLNIPMASTASVTAGLLSKADYDTFSAKLGAVAGTSLASGQIWVGNGSNQAAAVAVSGDATLSDAGALKVTALQNRAVASTAPSLGTYLKWNNTLSYWEPVAFPTCSGSDQAMHYNALTDTWSCDFIALSANTTGTLGVANGGTGKTSMAYVALTDGATITWTLSGLVNNATVTLAGNRALSLAGLQSGMTGTLIVKQDAAGTRTLTLPAECTNKVVNGGAGAVGLTVTPSAIDILTFTYDGTNCYWTYGRNFN